MSSRGEIPVPENWIQAAEEETRRVLNSKYSALKIQWYEDDEEEEDEEESDPDKRRWDELDHDLLIMIFQKLSVEDRILSVPLVCRSWLSASFNPMCWKTVDLHKWETLFRKFFPPESSKIVLDFQKLLKFVVNRSSGNMTSIVFPKDDLTDATLLYVARRCPRIKSLDFEGLCDVSKDAFCKALHSWKELEAIDVITPPLFCKETVYEIGKCCENFAHLRARGRISEEDVVAVATALPNLKILNLSFSTLNKNGLMALLTDCRTLESLDVTNCKRLEIDDEVLVKAEHLKEFKYGSAEGDEEEQEVSGPTGAFIFEEYVFRSDGTCHGEVTMVFH